MWYLYCVLCSFHDIMWFYNTLFGFDILLCDFVTTFCGLFTLLSQCIITECESCISLWQCIMTMWLLYSVIIILCQKKTLRYAVSLIHCSSLTNYRVVLLYAIASFRYYVLIFISLSGTGTLLGCYLRRYVDQSFDDVCSLSPRVTKVRPEMLNARTVRQVSVRLPQDTPGHPKIPQDAFNFLYNVFIYSFRRRQSKNGI